MDNLTELYMECYIMNRDKILEIQDIFEEQGFIVTHKDSETLSMLNENTYIEFYQESKTMRYYFHVLGENEEKMFYTDVFENIDKKIVEILRYLK